MNQRPGSPASCTAISVPLRDMSVTSVEPTAPAAASEAHLAAAMPRLRKKRWLAVSFAATSSPPSAANAGSSRRHNRFVVAWLRMCSSSPICRPCAARSKTSIGPVRASSRARSGPAQSRRNRAPASASSSPTPNHSVRPGPSFNVENARTPAASSSTTHTGIDGEQTPVIGPTWSCSLPLRNRTSPAASAAAAASRSSAHPSSRQAATSARRCGLAGVLPGHRRPACSSVRSSRPAIDLVRRRDGHRVWPRPLDRRQRRRVGRLDALTVRAPGAASAAPPARGRRRPAGASRRRSPSRPARAPPRRTAGSPTLTAATLCSTLALAP